MKYFGRVPKENPLQLASSTSLRMATMLRAGVTINRALELLSVEPGPVGELCKRVRDRNLRLDDLTASFSAEVGEPWKVFAVALEVAQKSGAPFAHACEKISHSFLKLDSLDQRRDVILAGPKSTVFLISTLPIIAVLVAEFVGINVLQEFAGLVGLLLLLIGLLLLTLGVTWSLRMIKRVQSEDRVSGIEMDLVGIALMGGQNIVQAVLLVADCIDHVGTRWVPLNKLVAASELQSVLKTAQASGSPLQPLLSTEANAQRDRAHASLEKKAEKLSVKILLPLGLFVLPSFICVGVMPLVIAMMR